MTKKEAVEAIHAIQSALALANKLNTCEEFEEALVLATKLIFYLKR